MTDVLQKICAYAQQRTVAAQSLVSEAVLKKLAFSRKRSDFKKALQKPGVRLIAEIKRASPSKGLIEPRFDYLEIARSYANADAISILTEPRWFMGGIDILTGVRRETDLPLLRKDFLLQPYNVYEAAAYGADAVLLITAALNMSMLKTMLAVCRDIGLDALVETHSAAEIDAALAAGADIIGVNSRDLTDFTVDAASAVELMKGLPPSVVKVAESGIVGADGIVTAANAGADAVLVGETLMRANDRAATVTAFKRAGGCHD